MHLISPEQITTDPTPEHLGTSSAWEVLCWKWSLVINEAGTFILGVAGLVGVLKNKYVL